MPQVDESDRPKKSLFSLVKDVLIGGIAVFGIIYVLLAIGASRAPSINRAQGGGASVSPGSEGRLDNGNPTVTVAIDQEVVADLVKASEGLNAPPLSGRFFYVPQGTEVRVIESSINAHRVRILSGFQKGRSGWVPFAWVRSASP